MSDVVVSIGADAAEFWAKMRQTERGAESAGKGIGDAFGNAGRKIDDMTGGMRKFVGSLSSTIGIATGILGTLGVIGGLVSGSVLLYDQIANASERAARAAKEELASRRDAAESLRDMLTRQRTMLGGGLGAMQQQVIDDSEAARAQLREQFKINELLERRAEIEKNINDLRDNRVSLSDVRSIEDALFGVDTGARVREYEQLNAEIARYSALLEDINQFEKDRLANIRSMTTQQGEAEERRLVLELLQAEGASRTALEFQEQTNHIERMRRLDELDALGYEHVDNLRNLEQQLHEQRLRQIAEEAAERERMEQQRLEAERLREEAARRHAELSGRSLEADILALQGEDEAARRLRIQLDLEREILRVKQDQTLTDEERARLIDLLNERAQLQLDERQNDRQQSFRTLQGGFVGAAQLAGRALGVESPEARLARERLEQGQKHLDRLGEILAEVEDIRRRGLPAVLN